ncbi:AMP-binding protein [Desulfobacter curvatus]|uniref:AMP-binding protein n=1 Tax=Desulfobacter curvatus TaxID=2290 RepID=UPI0003A387E2|nr:AMP-binding protein [Desulfobacter curvatus]
MNIFPDTLCINGTVHRMETLLKAGHQAWPPGIESDVFDFLAQWYGPENTITVHTSGSTGPPKPIFLEKAFVAQSAMRTLEFFELKPGQRILLCLPLRYIAGKLMVVRALLGRLDLCTAEPTDNFAFLGQCPANPFRFAAMVPNQVTKLLEYPERFNALGALLIGGSALPAILETELQTVPTACFASYGMTETATHIALRRTNGPGASDFFHCLGGISVGLSPSGCLTIEIPGLNTSDGSGAPLVTNDLAELIDSTTFRILGRADNVIISGGVKYFPETIEKKLGSAIEQPFFIGSLPDEILGRRMVLVIEATPDSLLEKRVAQLLVRYLDRYERPKKIVFKETFKRTETGKIIRQF